MASRRAATSSFNLSYFLILFAAAVVIGLLIIYWSVTRPICGNSCRDSLSLNVENDTSAIFEGHKIMPPKIDLSQKETAKKVLGEATGNGEKHIYVDLATQTLSAYEGETLYMQVPVSTGKWFPTPTGEFTIWEKLKSTKMSGGEGADYYYLPNVPYVMFFEGSGVSAGRGFSLHGAYWHNNFGHPMSHGCVNMRTVDAQKLYEWVNPIATGNITASTKDNPGTKITIYGQPPI